MGRTVVVISYQALPDRVAEALAAIGALIATVQAVEPDCSGITLIQNAADPTRLQLIEYWSSQESFLGPHMQQPHLQAFIQSASAFLSGPPEISFWRPVSPD